MAFYCAHLNITYLMNLPTVKTFTDIRTLMLVLGATIIFFAGCSASEPLADTLTATSTQEQKTALSLPTPTVLQNTANPASPTKTSIPSTPVRVPTMSPTETAVPSTPVRGPTPVISPIASPTRPTQIPTEPPPTTVPTSLAPTLTPTASATSTIDPTATVTLTPTITPTPSITPTLTQTPFPSPTTQPPTLVPAVDPFTSSRKAGVHSSKYGVIVEPVNSAILSSQLQTLDSDWYLQFDAVISSIPAGRSRPIYISISPDGVLKTTAQLQSLASVLPGAVWYVGGEPNRQFTVDEIIENLNYYYTQIKLVDPTARITSPSILNWEFTCIGCGGYTSGKTWMTELITRYQDLYGTLPPWDVWAIDLYPLDWHNFPNTGFLPETIAQYAPNLPPNSESIAAKQIDAYRTYIDSLPGRAGDPIIITELGIHWGWSSIEFGEPGCPRGKPAGEYKPLVLRDYFDSIFTWFEDHATSHNIERWFVYTTYSDVAHCRFDGYSGMSLFDSLEVNAELSDIGRWYLTRSAP